MNARSLAGALCAAALLACAQPAFADTTIAPGDVLDVTVFGEQQLTQQVTVAPDGSITLPLLGRVNLNGKTTTQASSTIASGLGKYIRHPLVAVGMRAEAQYNVLVLGNVLKPGRYTLQPGSKITDAIAAAGGMAPVNGAYPQARVSVGDKNSTVPLEALLRKGDLSQNLTLANNAAVYVPSPATLKVRVLGAVDHPGEIEVNQGDRVEIAIAKAGNSTAANADLNHIHITRDTSSGTKQMEVNLYAVLRDGKMDQDVVLQPNDVLLVPEAKKRTVDAAGGVLGVLRRLLIPW